MTAQKRRRKLKIGKLIRFLLIVAVIVAVVVFRTEIGHAVYDVTGITWFLSSNEQHELATMPEVNFQEVSRDPDFATPGDLPAPEPEPEPDLSEKLNLPEGNNILGITYSSTDVSPESLAVQSNTIYKVRITEINTSTSSNMIYTEYQAKVRKVYKGQEAKEINFSMMGGSVQPGQIGEGYVAGIAGKSKDHFGEQVNLVVDGQEPLQIDKEYILFANNQNGIITPSTGRSSFFLIEKRKVQRSTMIGEEPFSMGLGKFEREYLK